jgi:hypothetical protein
MPANPSASSIVGSVEVDLPWGGDFSLTDSGDLLIAADTSTSPAATIERLTRLVLTSPSMLDPNTGTPIQADDIFNPTWGAGAQMYVGAAVNAKMIQSLRSRVMDALVRDPGISPNPPPTVAIQMVGTYTLLMSIQFTSSQGQIIPLQVQMDASGVNVLPTSPTS